MVQAGISKAKQKGSELGQKKADEPSQLDNMLRVTTPENIAFQYEVVGPFRRLFAYIIDVLIVFGSYGLLMIAVQLLVSLVILPLLINIGGGTIFQEFLGIFWGLQLVILFVIYWFYGAYFETNFNGATLGKSLLKMRVIAIDGHAVDGVQAILRNFFRLLDLMPFLAFTALFEFEDQVPLGLPTCFFGLIVMMLNKRYQRLGDIVANTMVVNEERDLVPDLAMFDDPRVPQLAELIPDSFYFPRTMTLAIADYVDNRRRLNFQRASEIASYLSIPLLEKFRIPPDTDHDLFLCAVYHKIFFSQTDES